MAKIKQLEELARPYPSNLLYAPDAIWDYFIVESDQNVEGIARTAKTPDGLWQARYWEHVGWAPSAKTREQAILNVLPAAKAFVDAWRKQRHEYEKVYEQRQAWADILANRFRTRFSGTVSVRDEEANREKESEPSRYTVTIKYEGLTQGEVEALAREAGRP